jgi:hypothetical protein
MQENANSPIDSFYPITFSDIYKNIDFNFNAETEKLIRERKRLLKKEESEMYKKIKDLLKNNIKYNSSNDKKKKEEKYQNSWFKYQKEKNSEKKRKIEKKEIQISDDNLKNLMFYNTFVLSLKNNSSSSLYPYTPSYIDLIKGNLSGGFLYKPRRHFYTRRNFYPRRNFYTRRNMFSRQKKY